MLFSVLPDADSVDDAVDVTEPLLVGESLALLPLVKDSLGVNDEVRLISAL